MKHGDMHGDARWGGGSHPDTHLLVCSPICRAFLSLVDSRACDAVPVLLLSDREYQTSSRCSCHSSTASAPQCPSVR